MEDIELRKWCIEQAAKFGAPFDDAVAMATILEEYVFGKKKSNQGDASQA